MELRILWPVSSGLHVAVWAAARRHQAGGRCARACGRCHVIRCGLQDDHAGRSVSLAGHTTVDGSPMLRPPYMLFKLDAVSGGNDAALVEQLRQEVARLKAALAASEAKIEMLEQVCIHAQTFY